MITKLLTFSFTILLSTYTFAKVTSAEPFQNSIKKSQKEITACRNDASTSTLINSGRVFVEIEVNDKAQIQRIKINDEKTTLQDLNIQKCVIEVIKTVKFPKAAKGTTVSFTYEDFIK